MLETFSLWGWFVVDQMTGYNVTYGGFAHTGVLHT